MGHDADAGPRRQVRLAIVLGLAASWLLLGTVDAEAHPGGTDSSGGHHCRTNCAKWGLGQDEYHMHGGGSSGSVGGSSDGSSSGSGGSGGGAVQEAPSPEPPPGEALDVSRFTVARETVLPDVTLDGSAVTCGQLYADRNALWDPDDTDAIEDLYAEVCTPQPELLRLVEPFPAAADVPVVGPDGDGWPGDETTCSTFYAAHHDTKLAPGVAASAIVDHFEDVCRDARYRQHRVTLDSPLDPVATVPAALAALGVGDVDETCGTFHDDWADELLPPGVTPAAVIDAYDDVCMVEPPPPPPSPSPSPSPSASIATPAPEPPSQDDDWATANAAGDDDADAVGPLALGLVVVAAVGLLVLALLAALVVVPIALWMVWRRRRASAA